jgi:5'-deoxynucleotidase YfbR-like HD superfamily hydrolase
MDGLKRTPGIPGSYFRKSTQGHRWQVAQIAQALGIRFQGKVIEVTGVFLHPPWL